MTRKAILGAALLLAALGCSGKMSTADPKGKYGSADKQYGKADKLLKKKYYEQAIEEFERLRNAFPFSKYAVSAELKIADALFAKGNFAEAADSYRTFAKLHPKHEKIDYASYRVGLALFRDAPRSVDRDQTSVAHAMQEFRGFLARHPESSYAEDATKRVAEGRARLAEKELYIGHFYYRDKSYQACIPRLRRVVKTYPETDAARKALLLQGKAHVNLGHCPEAVKVFSEFLERYPRAESAPEARRNLRECRTHNETGKPTEVNEKPPVARNPAEGTSNN